MKYALIFSIFPIVGLVGCASDSDQLAKRLDEMKHELTRVKASNLALQDRVAALEEGGFAGAGGEEAELEPVADRPALQVVRVAPPEATTEDPGVAAPVAAAPEEDRPLIRQGFRGELEVVDEAKGRHP